MKVDKDITGQRFGRLTAIEPLKDPAPGLGQQYKLWKCRCDCGNISNVYYWSKRFGLLTVLRRSERTAPRGKRRVPLWECRCDCGAITYKATDVLTNASQNSCAQCASKHAVKAAREAAGYIDGTQISRIKDRKLSAANSSGVRGVYFEKKSNKWRARLRFKGKIMDFGSYERFEDAVAARKAAEKEYFDTFLEENGC